jgi:enoyl-CoA hydratase
MSDYETILVERRDRVVLVTLHRPEALNALNEQLMHEVVGVVAANDVDPGISVTVITGSARAFAAGADIKEMADKDAAQMAESDWLGEWDGIAAARKPVIAAVAGHALGGGCELALMCDLIIAADSAKFGQPEIKLGVIPGMGGSQRLTRAIGKARAMDLILTGRTIGAEEAERWGIVSRVVPADALLDAAMALAAELAEKSLPVLIAAKAAVAQAQEGPLAEGLRFERRSFHALFDLADQKEGMAAFVEKRKPDFQHR